MDRGMEEKAKQQEEIMSSSRSVILQLIASGKIKEEDVELTEKEKKLVESYRKTLEIIKENGIKVNLSTPID